jgi:hypothetical protein
MGWRVHERHRHNSGPRALFRQFGSIARTYDCQQSGNILRIFAIQRYRSGADSGCIPSRKSKLETPLDMLSVQQQPNDRRLFQPLIQEAHLPEASLKETELASAIMDPGMTCMQFSSALRSIQASERFWMQNIWTQYADNQKLDTWRRLAAYQILVERCIPYPREVRDFIAEAIRIMGIAEENLIDMTPAHNLPFERKAKQKIRMAILPIITADGPAALYFAIDEPNHYVELAKISPAFDDLCEDGKDSTSGY